ncbi:hypothetical protein D3C74_213190 [compost metagenome]
MRRILAAYAVLSGQGQNAIVVTAVTGDVRDGRINEHEASADLQHTDFGAFDLATCETVAPFKGTPIVVNGRCVLPRCFVERLLDRQHVIVDHRAGDKRPRQFGSHADRQHDEREDKCSFRR